MSAEDLYTTDAFSDEMHLFRECDNRGEYLSVILAATPNLLYLDCIYICRRSLYDVYMPSSFFRLYIELFTVEI